MKNLDIDATGLLDVAAYPSDSLRIEAAVIRQAIRLNGDKIRFFRIDSAGRARFLSRAELGYLTNLVHGLRPLAHLRGDRTLARRWIDVLSAIRSGAKMAGDGFDAAAARYLSGRDGRGAGYQMSRWLIRTCKWALALPAVERHGPDPLSEDGDVLLSTAGMQRIIQARRMLRSSASISAILHLPIPGEDGDRLESDQATQATASDLDWMFVHCDRMICLSATSAARASRYAIQRGFRDPSAISIVRPGASLKEAVHDYAEPVVALLGKRFALLSLAAATGKEGRSLLALWAGLLPELDRQMPRLAIHARPGQSTGGVASFLRDHPELQAHVQVLQEVSDPQLAWLCQSAEFALFPSPLAGSAMEITDCLDCGLPVITASTPEWIEAAQSLMPAVEPDDYDGWRDAITQASTDFEWTQELRGRIRMGYHSTSERAFATHVLSIANWDQSATSMLDRIPKALPAARACNLKKAS